MKCTAVGVFDPACVLARLQMMNEKFKFLPKDLLVTPTSHFDGVKEWDLAPLFLKIQGLSIHYVDVSLQPAKSAHPLGELWANCM